MNLMLSRKLKPALNYGGLNIWSPRSFILAGLGSLTTKLLCTGGIGTDTGVKNKPGCFAKFEVVLPW